MRAWILLASLWLGFTAHASTTQELLEIIKKSPTGYEIAVKLELLLEAPSLNQRVEIFYPHEISKTDTALCDPNGEIAARTLPPDAELHLPIRIIFCQYGTRSYMANILAHEAVHAIDRALTPQGIRLFHHIEHFFDQTEVHTPEQFQEEIEILDGFTDINILVREYKAYAMDFQIFQELIPLFPHQQGHTPLLIDPRKDPHSRHELIRHNIGPSHFRSIVKAYQRIQQRPDILSDLDHFIPRSDLEEMIAWIENHQDVESETRPQAVLKAALTISNPAMD